jgi:hypothetical protein
VFEIEKCAVFSSKCGVINRLIHRTWGEGFVHIFHDLFVEFSHFSPRFLSVSVVKPIKMSLKQIRAGKQEKGEGLDVIGLYGLP